MQKLIWEIVELILDDYYFAYSPGHTGQIVHLSDDCFIGYNLDFKTNKINLFNLYECEFDKKDENGNIFGEQNWTYYLPNSFDEFLDLLNKHQLLFDNNGYDIDKKYLLDQYLKYDKTNYKPYVESLASKYFNI